MELTDLEIIKRVAYIDRDDVIDVYEHKHDGVCVSFVEYGMVLSQEYNPLTDDGLCFKFCYESGISVNYVECPAGSGKAYYANKGLNSTDYCGTPNMAVCLAYLDIFTTDEE